jgi:hypothetical protein
LAFLHVSKGVGFGRRSLSLQQRRAPQASDPRRCFNLKELHALGAFLRCWVPLHVSLFARGLRLGSTARKGRRGDSDYQAESDNREQGFHGGFLQCFSIGSLDQKSDASLEKRRYFGSREEVSQGHFAKVERALPQANCLPPSIRAVPDSRGVGFGRRPFL